MSSSNNTCKDPEKINCQNSYKQEKSRPLNKVINETKTVDDKNSLEKSNNYLNPFDIKNLNNDNYNDNNNIKNKTNYERELININNKLSILIFSSKIIF